MNKTKQTCVATTTCQQSESFRRTSSKRPHRSTWFSSNGFSCRSGPSAEKLGSIKQRWRNGCVSAGTLTGNQLALVFKQKRCEETNSSSLHPPPHLPGCTDLNSAADGQDETTWSYRDMTSGSLLEVVMVALPCR